MDIFDTQSRLPPWWRRAAAWPKSRVALAIGAVLAVVLAAIVLGGALGSATDTLVVFVAIVVAVAVAEFALRAVLPKPMRNYLWIPRSSVMFHATPEGSPGVTGPARFVANSFGLRADEPMPDRRHTVYVFGGSTAVDLFLDHRDAWVLRLQAELSAGGSPTWVAPLARPGLMARHASQLFDGLTPDLPRADLFVHLCGVNDLQWAIGSSYARTAADPCQPIFFESPGRLGQSGLGRIYWWWRDHLISRVPATKSFPDDGHIIWRRSRQGAPPENFVDQLPDVAAALVEYERDIVALIEQVRAYGATILFLTQPTIWRADMAPDEQALLFCGGVGPNNVWQTDQRYYTHRALAEGMQRFNDTLIATCARHGCPCYDLAADVPPTKANYFDDMHFTNAGARLVGSLVAQAIQRMGLLRGR